MMLFSKLLLTIRSTVFYLGFYLGTVVISSLFIISFPLLSSKGRHLFAGTWCGFSLFWLRLCCGVRYEIHGLENLSESPNVIMANHQSAWETILFYKLVFPVSPI